MLAPCPSVVPAANPNSVAAGHVFGEIIYVGISKIHLSLNLFGCSVE
jgi:hypothetical protein